MTISSDYSELIVQWISNRGYILVHVNDYSIEFKKTIYGKWYFEISVLEDNIYVLSILKEENRHIPFDLGPFDMSMAIEDEKDLHNFIENLNSLSLNYEDGDKAEKVELVNFSDCFYRLHVNGVALSMTTFFTYLKFDKFLSDYIDSILNLGLDEFYWEHPEINSDRMMGCYEVSIIESETLKNVKPNSRPFASYFNDNDFVKFMNRGNNAILIVPVPNNDDLDYSTISRFLTNADRRKSIEFFKYVFIEWESNVSRNSEFKYLSTHGLGVHWLHVRCDKQPKYYHTKKYK